MLEQQIHARKSNAQNCKAATPVVNALSRDNPGCATLKNQSEEVNELEIDLTDVRHLHQGGLVRSVPVREATTKQ
jgi:hypothetical protein